VESGKHLRGPSEQSICLLIFTSHMPFRFSGGSLYICVLSFLFSSFRFSPTFLLPLDLSTSTSFHRTDCPRRLLTFLSLHMGRQRCRFLSSLYCPSISTSCTCTLHLLYPRACMSQVPPFTLFFYFYFFKVLISFIPLFIEPAWLVALWCQPWQQMETISDQTVFLVDLFSLIALFLNQP
jgi:hypothetical protein